MHFSGVLLVAPASRFFLNYTPTRREWVACAITLAGITALVFHGLRFDNLTVVLVSLGAGVSQLIGQLCMSWLSKNDEAIQRETGVKRSSGGKCFMIAEVITVVAGLGISVTTYSSLHHFDTDSCAHLAILGILTWGVPNFLALLAVRTHELISLGLLWLCDPVFVATWPVLAGQDPLPRRCRGLEQDSF